MVRVRMMNLSRSVVNTFLGPYDPAMKQTDPQFKLRLPAALKERLDAAATEGERTLTAEIVSRLEATFSPIASNETVAALVADLAKAKRDVAYLAYGRQEKLIQLMFLYDLYRDAVEVAEALGVPELLPQSDRDLADSLGSEANQEIMRQEEKFEPYFLYDDVKSTEQELQEAIAKLTEFVASQRPPSVDDSTSLQALRDRIRKRRQHEYAQGKYIRDPSNEQTPEEIAHFAGLGSQRSKPAKRKKE